MMGNSSMTMKKIRPTHRNDLCLQSAPSITATPWHSGLVNTVGSTRRARRMSPMVQAGGRKVAGLADYLIPPFSYRRVHFSRLALRFSFSMFLRDLLSLNQYTDPSLLMYIIPVPGSISSLVKLQILCSGTISPRSYPSSLSSSVP